LEKNIENVETRAEKKNLGPTAKIKKGQAQKTIERKKWTIRTCMKENKKRKSKGDPGIFKRTRTTD